MHVSDSRDIFMLTERSVQYKSMLYQTKPYFTNFKLSLKIYTITDILYTSLKSGDCIRQVKAPGTALY